MEEDFETILEGFIDKIHTDFGLRSDIKNIFPELELSDLKNNGFIDLLNILNEDQIKMLRLIYF